MPGGELPARGTENLDPAGDALPVGGTDRLRKDGVGLGKQRMGMGPRFGDLRPDPLPNLFRYLGNGRKPFDKGAEIKPRAADNDGETPARCDLTHHPGGANRPEPGRERLASRDHAIKMMRHARFLRLGGTRGQHPHLAIELHGIGIHDFAAEPFGQRKRQRRLAAGGRPCNKDGSAHRLTQEKAPIRFSR